MKGLVLIEKKLCSRCNELKDVSLYYKHNSNKDGLFPYCKDCTKKASVKQRGENYNRYIEGQRKRNLQPLMKAAKKRYNEGDKKKETQLVWQRNNKDRIDDYRLKRNIHKKHVITETEWEECKEYFNYSCAYCGMSYVEHKEIFNQDLHKEHVDHNGANDISNCIPACKSCNSAKHDSDFENWYIEGNSSYTEERITRIKNWLSKF